MLDDDGESLFARAVTNDEADLDDLLAKAAEHGVVGAWRSTSRHARPARYRGRWVIAEVTGELDRTHARRKALEAAAGLECGVGASQAQIRRRYDSIRVAVVRLRRRVNEVMAEHGEPPVFQYSRRAVAG